MKNTKLFLTAIAALASGTVVSHGMTTLIGLGLNEGNGDFNVTDAGQVIVSTGGPAATIDIARARAFIQFPNAGGPTISVNGWTFQRSVATGGGNSAFGTDSGFALEPTTGTNGQFFANKQRVTATSDSVSHSFSVGDELTLSFSIGSDTASPDNVVSAIPTLVFDRGLASEFTQALTTQTATGSGSFTETYTTTSAFSTVELELDLGNLTTTGSVRRAVADEIVLTVIPEPSSTLLAGLGMIGLLRRRR